MGFGTLGGANPDNVTLDKNISGQLRIKPNLTYPAGNGNALTDLSIKIMTTYIWCTATTLKTTVASAYNFFTSNTWNTLTPSTIQGTWGLATNAAQLPETGYYHNGTTHANLDQINLALTDLPAGTYTLYGRCYTGPNLGIIDIGVDGASKGTFDEYSGGNVFSVAFSMVLGALAAGNHTLNIKCNGKNASSSDNIVTFSDLAIVRTG